jgi:hypothetical protein
MTPKPGIRKLPYSARNPSASISQLEARRALLKFAIQGSGFLRIALFSASPFDGGRFDTASVFAYAQRKFQSDS